MKIKTKITGDKKLQAKFESAQDVNFLVFELIHKFTTDIKLGTQRAMRTPKSGRLYHYSGRTYRASAPGQVPAFRSGDLYRSIQTTTEALPGFVKGTVYTDIKYAKILRDTLNRPIFEPAADKVDMVFAKVIKNTIERKFK